MSASGKEPFQVKDHEGNTIRITGGQVMVFDKSGDLSASFPVAQVRQLMVGEGKVGSAIRFGIADADGHFDENGPNWLQFEFDDKSASTIKAAIDAERSSTDSTGDTEDPDRDRQ